MKRLTLTATLLALFACSGAPETGAPAPRAVKPVVAVDADEKANLLNLAHGAAVVSRNAELTLDHSALRAIDGDSGSPWISPPDDTVMAVTLSLPAPAMIDKVGFHEPRAVATSLQSVAFETSLDGVTFTPATTLNAKKVAEVQLASITPVRAQYIRASISKTETQYSGVASLHARGQMEAVPAVPPIAGCWSFNGFSAAMQETNGRITGIVKPEDPVHLEGAADGATYRFSWSHGAEAGIALVTMSPDGQWLSGAKWYEQPVAEFWGDSWFGKRTPCAAPAAAAQPPHRAWLRRRGRYALYTFREKDPSAAIAIVRDVLQRTGDARIRLVSREFRQDSEDANVKVAQQRLGALEAALQKSGADLSRIDFESLGSARPHAPVVTDAARLLFSVIEVEVPDTARRLF